MGFRSPWFGFYLWVVVACHGSGGRGSLWVAMGGVVVARHGWSWLAMGGLGSLWVGWIRWVGWVGFDGCWVGLANGFMAWKN